MAAYDMTRELGRALPRKIKRIIEQFKSNTELYAF